MVQTFDIGYKISPKTFMKRKILLSSAGVEKEGTNLEKSPGHMGQILGESF